MLYADNLVLMAPSREELQRKVPCGSVGQSKVIPAERYQSLVLGHVQGGGGGVAAVYDMHKMG